MSRLIVHNLVALLKYTKAKTQFFFHFINKGKKTNIITNLVASAGLGTASPARDRFVPPLKKHKKDDQDTEKVSG